MSGRGRRGDRLMGYADRWSVHPGETVEFMVSCAAEGYEAEIVRLTRGGPRTRGAPEAFAFEPAGGRGRYPGRVQELRTGSYVTVDDGGRLGGLRALVLQAWVYPTAPGGIQGIVTRWCHRTRAGFGLVADDSGALAVRVGDMLLSTGVPMLTGHWYQAVASIDLDRGTVRLAQRPSRVYTGHPDRALVRHTIPAGLDLDGDVPTLIGGDHRADGPRGGFNGKIEAPCVLDRALDDDAMARVLDGSDARTLLPGAIRADWDFGAGMPTRRVTDVSGADLHGTTVNSPMRAVTGHRWRGEVLDHRLAPGEYAAIHFHDDDLDDAGWDVAFGWQVPAGARSGAYAARLTAGDDEDFVVFFVRPPRDRATAPVAFLASTFTYTAYSNFGMNPVRAAELTGESGVRRDEVDPVLAARDDLGRSLYDSHGDGSLVVHVSRLRPMLNARPTYRFLVSGGGGWSFGGDMYVIDWLEASGVPYDVITDDDLHTEGAELLERYRVLVTGAHPEYATREMLDAIEGYTARGGRLMYLGGNGFYWVTTVLPDRPHVMEVRRGHAGTRTGTSAPGETYHTTGEPGGLWRHRGRPPQRLVGVGFTAQGGGPSAPYAATAASRDRRVAFLFEGVDRDAPIGDFGNNGGGAAGEEIDRADVSLGTPPHALVVATSQGRHTDLVQHVIEENTVIAPNRGGTQCAEVRADLTYFETPGGGAVFSTGSIDWSASLSHDDYDNSVARMTGNVLRHFLADPPS